MRTSSGQLANVFGGVSLTRTLWPHQARALGALDRASGDQAHGDQARAGKATYLVVPPGGGKTLIGLEAARRHNSVQVSSFEPSSTTITSNGLAAS